MEISGKKTLNPDGALKRGYLVEDYRVFHIDSLEKQEIPPHFHGFHKLIFLIRGDLRYIIDGVSCQVNPGEVLLVPAFSIHQPVIGPKTYERTVLWVNPEAKELKGLEETFRMAEHDRSYVIPGNGELRELFRKLAGEGQENGREAPEEIFGNDALRSARVTEITVYAGRSLMAKQKKAETARDILIAEIIEYISAHPEENLTAKRLSEKFYVSESSLCARFVRSAGCSLHQYVLQKRLTEAAKKMRSGVPSAEAASLAGFSDYSAFFRAFKKYFEVSPRQFTASSGWRR